MAIDRRRGASKLPSPDDRMRSAAVSYAKPPGSDPTGAHHAACRDIADEAGVDVADVLDAWSERAAVRQYDGNVSIDEAERLAVDDVRSQYVKQLRLAP